MAATAERVRTDHPLLAPLAAGGRRRAANRFLWALGVGAALLVAAPVASILVQVVRSGTAHWQWRTLVTPTQGTGGGLSQAIVGTVVIVLGVLVLAGLVGVAGGVYLAEYCPKRWAGVLRGASEVLAGVPSIVLGYVGYIALAVAFHWGLSLGAALVTMSVLVLPYIVKSTESALRQVPTGYREGGEALGMPAGQVLRKLVLRPALPGITTGLIVAAAVAVGETAPLLYTAGWSTQYPTAQLTHTQVAYLPYLVWTFYGQPYASAQRLSHVAALLLIVGVLLLILASRLVVHLTQRYSPDRHG